MKNLDEIQFYWSLMQSLTELRKRPPRVGDDALFAELIDEIEVMHLMTDCPKIRKRTATTLAQFADLSGVACS